MIALNLIRFAGFDQSPPGFYIDEAAGAANVLCIKQTGHDYSNVALPLFSAGPGGGYFTAPYVYGQIVWTSIFGESTAGFRSFAAFVTSLAILFLTLFVRKRAGDRTALWVALLATISPWVFQFSRIAWDPPMAPMFIVLGLYLTTRKGQYAWLWSSIAFALATYAYPPTRAQVPLLLILMPGMSWATTIRMIVTFLVLIIPVFIKSLEPAFTMRARMLVVTSDHPMNPYREANLFEMIWIVIRQIGAHLGFNYLVVDGDANFRHSTRQFGMMSWTQFGALAGGLIFALIRPRLFFKTLSSPAKELLWLGVVGSLLGILPAALTWEGVPHAIRSIGAWPFLCILGGVMIELFVVQISQVSEKIGKLFQGAVWVSSLGFFALYLNVFFGWYASASTPWYQLDEQPVSRAYSRMMSGERCADLR